MSFCECRSGRRRDGLSLSLSLSLSRTRALRTNSKDTGYERVSATRQNFDRQLAMLKAEGCGRVFKEKVVGPGGRQASSRRL